MKKLLSIAAILAFFLSTSPVIAGDDEAVNPCDGSSTEGDPEPETPTAN